MHFYYTQVLYYLSLSLCKYLQWKNAPIQGGKKVFESMCGTKGSLLISYQWTSIKAQVFPWKREINECLKSRNYRQIFYFKCLIDIYRHISGLDYRKTFISGVRNRFRALWKIYKNSSSVKVTRIVAAPAGREVMGSFLDLGVGFDV